jgi:3-hydroxyisobutyrate dehydrogenase-like beta-hydroxyacid dehydrogenase
MEMSETVGVIGLGIMGGAISANLLRAGFSVAGVDVDETRVEALAALGGAAAASPEALARTASTIILSLPSSAALAAVVGGDAGLLASGRRGLTVLECSTLPLEDKQVAHDALGAAGITLLDCPISGTGGQAATKDIVVFASGERAAYEAAVPVIEGFAKRHRHIGPFGDGSKLKFVANLLIADHVAAAAEAMVLGAKAGLDPKLVHQVIAASPASSAMFDLRARLMAEDDYLPAMMKMDLWQKDVGIIEAFIESLGVHAPLFAAGAALYRQALADGLTKEDTAAVCRVVERLSDGDHD